MRAAYPQNRHGTLGSIIIFLCVLSQLGVGGAWDRARKNHRATVHCSRDCHVLRSIRDNHWSIKSVGRTRPQNILLMEPVCPIRVALFGSSVEAGPRPLSREPNKSLPNRTRGPRARKRRPPRLWRSPFLVKKWAEPFGQRVRTYVTHPEPAKAGLHRS